MDSAPASPRRTLVVALATAVVAATVSVAAALVGLATPAVAAAAPTAPTEIAVGHIDVASVIEDDALATRIKTGVGATTTLLRPETVVLRVKDAARRPLPDSLAFLGAPGSDAWALPQAQNRDLLWPGWSTELIAPDRLATPVTWRLDAVRGPGTKPAPGRFSLLTFGTFGAVSVKLGDADQPKSLDIAARVHAHGGWYFTAPGVYCLDITRSATVDGRPQRTSSTLAFAVGDSTTTSAAAACHDGAAPPTDPSPTPAPTPSPEETPAPERLAVLSQGHVDLASTLRGGRLDTVVRDGSGAEVIERDPADVLWWVRPEAKVRIPAGFDALGTRGTDAWLLPQLQDPRLLWPGWSTEDVAPTSVKGAIAWGLDRVTAPGGGAAPGRFVLFDVDSTGRPDVLMTSLRPDGPDLAIAPLVHAHGSWSFTAPGTYCVATSRSAVRTDGERLLDRTVLTIVVGGDTAPAVARGTCAADIGSTDAAPTTSGAKTTKGAKAAKGSSGSTGADGSGSPGPATATACAVTGATTVGAPGTVDIATGHLDYATRLVEGRLRSVVKDGTTSPARWREPENVRLVVGDAARTTVPASRFGFLGAPGSPIWQLPQTQDARLPWLGWNTEEIGRADLAGPVRFSLSGVRGPGRVVVYTLDAFGAPSPVLGTGRSLDVPVGVHAHANWAFTAPGDYVLTLRQSARTSDGRDVADTATLAVRVGSASVAAPAADAGCTAPVAALAPPADAPAPAAPVAPGPAPVSSAATTVAAASPVRTALWAGSGALVGVLVALGAVAGALRLPRLRAALLRP